ncbi:MAG: LysR family transcriptional regulator [Alphaproteobacteria bacterium]|nr:LysR family transcriptional regulator [Alphaproteobacteria bacterium]
MTYTLRHVRYFAAAAEAGSVTAAAQALHVSQPSVSTAIAELEAEFGVQLLVRHHAQGISLTPAGRRILAEARELLDRARAFEAHARGQAEEIAGTLELGCFVTFAPIYLPRLLAEARARHPAMAVRVREGSLDAVREALEAGETDLAILYDMGLGQAVETEELARLPTYALLPAHHRLAKAERVALAELAEEPLVLLDLPASREFFLSIFMALGLEPRIGQRSSSYEMVRGLVAQGHGYTLLNTRPATEATYGGGRVVAKPLKDRVPKTRVVLARLKRALPTRMAEAFAALARAHFKAARATGGV